MKYKRWQLPNFQRGSVTWNSNTFNAGLLSLWLLSACSLEVPQKPVQSTPIVKASVAPTPTSAVSKTPIPLPSQGTSFPTVYPSVPTINYTETPIPGPSAPFAAYRHLEEFSATAFCLPVEQTTTNPRLRYPVDVAVSKDGQTVFAMNKRCDAPLLSRMSPILEDGCKQFNYKTENPIVKREYIYSISKNKDINIVKINGISPLSCQIGEDIEIDTQGNLYLNTPGKNRLYRVPSDMQTIELLGEYKETTSSQDEFSANCNSSTECPATGLLMGPYDIQIKSAHVYFILKSPFINSYNPGQLREWTATKQATTIIKSNWNFAPYAVQMNNLFFSDSNGIGKVSVGESFSNCLLSNNCMFTGGILINNGERRFSGTSGFIDGPPEQALFKGIRALRTDASGHLYVIDLGNHAIRKVTPDGNVTTLAGNGQPGFKDGKGREAQFNYPTAIDLDDAGTIYVADTGNHAIRKITPDGLVSTFYAETNPN